MRSTRNYSLDELFQAYLSAARRRGVCPDVLVFSSNLEYNLIDLQNRLIWEEPIYGMFCKSILDELEEL